jgi:glyoxylase-like metal-dependent hydrolase (beta-lactamase superfamily II)
MAKIFPLSEGEFTVGHDKQILPFNPAADKLGDRAVGSLHIEIQPFLVVTDKDLIILDTGLGLMDATGVLQIHSNILKLGYEPGSITKVFHSHLHKDHCGGMVFIDDHGLVHPTFPNADYYFYRPEVDYALQTGAPSYDAKHIEDMLSVVDVKWLDGEDGLIDGYIQFNHTGGHCPQHIVSIIEEGTDKIFYGGDEAPQLKQMQIKYIAKYDYDGKKALAIREHYAAIGRKEGWKFLFYHDVKCGVAVL